MVVDRELSTAPLHAVPTSGTLLGMGELAVRPGAVSAAAEVLRDLAVALDVPTAPPVVGGAVQAAVAEFAEVWAVDAQRLAELARRAADVAVMADERYRQLERLLIPVALR